MQFPFEQRGFIYSVVKHHILKDVNVCRVDCCKCNWWITVDGAIWDFMIHIIEEEHPFICGMTGPCGPYLV